MLVSPYSDGKWINSELRVSCAQLTGKTVGLFGLGNIAKHVIKQLQGFETPIIYFSRTRLDPEFEKEVKCPLCGFSFTSERE
jgi:D-3-phosphoglycerate dehydrogenase